MNEGRNNQRTADKRGGKCADVLKGQLYLILSSRRNSPFSLSSSTTIIRSEVWAM